MGKTEIKKIVPGELDAVIFDMDGVVTDTADIHAAAWKQMFDDYLKKYARQNNEPFQPFNAEQDYHFYVDGKPRYDGVKSFLKSRGISLPYGSPEDKPDKETICGLGNRKNRYYLEHLKKHRAKSYPSSVIFIKQLRESGIGTAIISASRNAKAVLKAAGIHNLFDVKVDGVDSNALHLEGKPHPAIFLEAARRLGIKPDRAAIVEDSLAGVDAGHRGGFKLVIGVDRSGQGVELKRRGADIVVTDLSQLQIG